MPGKYPAPKYLTILFTLFFLFPTLFLRPSPLPAQEAAESVVGAGVSSPQAAVLLPLSGPFAELGKSLRQVFEQGFSYVAANGDQKISVSYLDTESNPETARTLVELLASEGQVRVAAGTPLNPCAWTASKAAEKNGLPYLIVGADQDNLINEKSAFAFRVTRPRAAFGKMLSGFIKSRKPTVQSLAIIRGENPCALRNARRLRQLCAELGLDLDIWETYRNNESNFYDLLNLVRDQKPEILLLATSPAASRKFWLQGKRLEIMPKYTLMIPDDCFPAASEPASQAPPAGLLLPTDQQPLPANKQNYPALTDPRQAAAFATAQLIAWTLKKTSGPSPAAVTAALEKTKLDTIYGKIAFTGAGAGHQNQSPWLLVTTTPEGETRVVFSAQPKK